MIEKAKELIEKRDFSGLESLWMEKLDEKGISIAHFLRIADGLKSIKETSRAFMLLEILASHLSNEKQIDEAIEVYKHMVYFTEDDSPIRVALVNLFKVKYGDNERIEKFIELSGIEKETHLFKSLERLEDFLKYDIGRVFYFEKFGLGEVVSMNPEKKELVIDFKKQKGYFLKLDVARGLLQPVPEGTFLYKKYKNIEELRLLANKDPAGLVLYLLKSIKEPLTTGDIKNHLKDVIDENEIDRFWESVRKRLEKDECIKVESKKGQKVYQFISGISKKDAYIESFKKGDTDEKYSLVERCAKEQPEIFNEMIGLLISFANENYKTIPARALDILYLCEEYKKTGINYTVDEILKYEKYENIILNLKTSEHKKKFLEEIKKRESGNWQKIYQLIMGVSDDTKLINQIETELKNSGFDITEFYNSVLLMPQKLSGVFQYMLKNIANGSLQEFAKPKYLPRMINNLEYIKGVKNIFFKGFTLERFDGIIKKADVTEAKKIKDALIKSTVLKDYEKNDYIKIIDYHFPQLKEKKEDYIYTTQAALERKKKELEYLLVVEIPENKKEISRAREFGDLSENFEYKAAKERQDQLYQRVRMLESELHRAKIIDLNNVDTSRVGIGTKVTLKSLKDDSTIEYTILGPWDGDLSKNIISNESPLAKNILLEKKIGDRIIMEGQDFEIIKIEPAKI